MKKDCFRDAVEFVRGADERVQIHLTRCDGSVVESAVEQLSVLLRPWSAPKPKDMPDTAPSGGKEWAPGVKRIEAALVSRLQKVAQNYKGKAIQIVSGYRPASIGSYHKDAKAIDFRVEGVRNEELVTFCRGLADTGCGYYPNSSFVHMDARPAGTGHVYWIDASGPGEAPRYVATWPPEKGKGADEIKRPDHAAPKDEQTHGDFHRRKADVDGKDAEEDREVIRDE